LVIYFGVSGALESGDIWVPISRVHRSLQDLLTQKPNATAKAAVPLSPNMTLWADEWLAQKSEQLDSALLDTAQGIAGKDAGLFSCDKLRFSKGPKAEEFSDKPSMLLAISTYHTLPTIRITDVLSQVARWTGFVDHLGHVSSGLPPSDERAFFATLIAEATNLGLTRMADIWGVASRRALLRMQIWHMRKETFRAALGCLSDAIHGEPMAPRFGEGWCASADGQHFYLCGPGEGGGAVNAHYGRDPIVKIYTTVTDRYALLHQTVIAGTAGEAIHALDGILGHESGTNIISAVMHLLGLDFESRIPRLSDRKLFGFEP
jgi:Tn3 transposase DDE domain